MGDWVIFYEGRAGGNRGYYAVQRVEKIVDDPVDEKHSYAILDRGTLLSFESLVPRKRPSGRPYETGLPDSGGLNASAVRIISPSDFAAIVAMGLRASDTPDALPRVSELPNVPGFFEGSVTFERSAQEDEIRERFLTSRAFRDASFARQIKRAYGARCAMSGLELRNGGGRPEVVAAHNVPVAERGPDTVENGLALSGTLHWMFDRGLLSATDNYSILVAKGSVADEISGRLLTEDRKLILPRSLSAIPHPSYLKWHRDNVFKG